MYHYNNFKSKRKQSVFLAQCPDKPISSLNNITPFIKLSFPPHYSNQQWFLTHATQGTIKFSVTPFEMEQSQQSRYSHMFACPWSRALGKTFVKCPILDGLIQMNKDLCTSRPDSISICLERSGKALPRQGN